MASYFEVKVSYDKVDERSGKDKHVTIPYLVDAVSFTECEAIITKELKDCISAEIKIKAITRSKIQDVYSYEESGYWFLCNVDFVDADEKSGREKVTKNQMLVNASDFDVAKTRLKKELKTIIIPYTIVSIKQTKIEEVYKHLTK